MRSWVNVLSSKFIVSGVEVYESLLLFLFEQIQNVVLFDVVHVGLSEITTCLSNLRQHVCRILERLLQSLDPCKVHAIHIDILTLGVRLGLCHVLFDIESVLIEHVVVVEP